MTGRLGGLFYYLNSGQHHGYTKRECGDCFNNSRADGAGESDGEVFMSGFKGTPGEWIVDESGDVMTDVACVAIVAAGMIEVDGEPSKGMKDAWLIAAAPELLEALELILSYHDDGNCKLHKEDVAMARASIAKALGNN